MYKFISALVVLFCLQIISCMNTASQPNQAHSVVNSAPSPTSQEEGANKTEGAIPVWKKHFYRALELRVQGKLEEAVGEYQKSIDTGNDDKEVYREIALIFISMKRYEDAAVNLRKLLDKDPKDPAAHWALARILVENLERYEEGLNEAGLAQKLYGNDGGAHVRERIVGKAYDGLGDYSNAIKHYKIFLKGSSYAPEADDYKVVEKRVAELEKIVKDSEGKSPNK